MAGKVLNIKVYSPLKLYSSLTVNYHVTCHYLYNLPLASTKKKKVTKIKNDMKKVIFVILAICTINLWSQAQVTAELANVLQTALDNSTSANGITGSSAAVWVEGQGMWLGVSGFSHDNVNITSNMRFGMGSITKNFTATLCLKLQEDNLLDLDDPISTWLPDIDNVNSNITLRQLLGHRSGVADYTDSPDFFPGVIDEPNTVWTPEEIIALIGPPLFEPGTQTSYSNTNYILAGMILEAVTNNTYKDLLEEKIFTPLGLENIYVEAFEPVQGNIAHPHVQGMDIFAVPRTSIGTISWSAGCLVSTPEELTNWWKAYFNNFLTEDSKSQAKDFQPWTGQDFNLGLGLMQFEFNQRNYEGHGGQTIGYNAFSAFDTNNKHIISVMVNDAFGESQNLVRDLAEALDGALTLTNEITKEKIDFSFYPNPVSQNLKLNVNLSKRASAQLEIINSNGMVVKNRHLGQLEPGENQILLSINDLSNGIYFIKLWGKSLPPVSDVFVINK